MFFLVAYLALVMYLIIPKDNQGRFSKGLTWVYHMASEVHEEKLAWPHVVEGVLLLLGTVSPFLLFRWWTVVTALMCGALYALIGYQAAPHNFVL
jgi:hypothetical protein